MYDLFIEFAIMPLLMRIEAASIAIPQPPSVETELVYVQRTYMRYAVSEEYHREWHRRLIELAKHYSDPAFINLAKLAFESSGWPARPDNDVQAIVRAALLHVEEFRVGQVDRVRLEGHIGFLDRLVTDLQARDPQNQVEIGLASRALGYVYQQLSEYSKARLAYRTATEHSYPGQLNDPSFDEDVREVKRPRWLRGLRLRWRRFVSITAGAPRRAAAWAGAVMAIFVIAIPLLFDMRILLRPLAGASTLLLFPVVVVAYLTLAFALSLFFQWFGLLQHHH